MNAKQFSVALGEVDDKFITEALTYQCTTQSVRRKTHSIFNRLNTASKRIAAVAAVVIVLFSSAMSVAAIRVPFIEMVKTFFETYILIDYSGDVIDCILDEYEITHIPEGFSQQKRIATDNGITTEYANNENETISFRQRISDGTQTTIDKENATSQIIYVTDREVHLVVANNAPVMQAFWTDEVYSFTITCVGDISMDELTAMIESAQEIE